MTVVKPHTRATEKLVYYYLKCRDNPAIKQSIENEYGVSISLNSIQELKEVCWEYRGIFFPNNINNPDELSQNSWFDMFSDRIGINVKWGIESTANSRIRDLTKGAVEDINEIIRNDSKLGVKNAFSYDQFRNSILRTISEKIRCKNFPIKIDNDIRVYLKLAYLVCMSFLGGENKNRDVFFINFTTDFHSSIHRVASPYTSFNVQKFVKDVGIEFSTNQIGDPHKQTIKYFIKKSPIGFLELRSNGRAMLHLRKTENHWANLFKNFDQYKILVKF